MKKQIFRKSVLLLVLFAAVVYGAQKSWWDRFMPGKNPDVLKQDGKSTPLVNPHPDVINLQNSFAEIADAVKPAVVNISAVQIQRIDPHQFYYGDPNEFFYRYFGGQDPRRPQPREQRTEGTGSGVIIDAEGYILTNNHVVQGADQLTITLSTGKTYKGKVMGTDPRSDLAVVRIKGSNPFPFLPLGDSSAMKVGDWVLAIGSPFGLEQTVTAGIVSAIRQSLNIEGKSFRNLLQTDAAINRGNSGGPLVNIRGELIGVNTAIYAPTGVFSGIGFAIPINDAKQILKDLIQKGYVERSWMGVEIAEVDDVIAQQFGLPNAKGALINQVVAESPAAKAGLKRGDVILEFDGKKIDTVQQLQDFVSSTPPKKKVRVKVLRDGSAKTVDLTTDVLPNQQQASLQTEDQDEKSATPSTVKWLGATASNITRGLYRRYGDDEGENEPVTEGVIITDVPAKSDAAEAGLQEGDIVQGVNQKPVRSVSDLEKTRADLKKGVVLDIVRRGKSFYLSYKSVQ